MRVTVNAAMSVDGKLSTRRREQVAISGPADFERVDALRADHDAVTVGVGTVLADDPSLTVDPDRGGERAAENPRQPARVVADSRARTPPDAALFDGDGQVYVLTSAAAPDDRRAALREAGAAVVAAGTERVALPEAFEALEERGVGSVMVEGGGELVFSLFEAALVDRLSVYVGSVVIGGRDAPTLADGEGFVDPDTFPELSLSTVRRVDDGVLLGYDVQ
jgi:2,5-diamino-6-(ribosylamino)-4(3H)-pyrimidinone 5'-phosphate reductase